ncbi:MAG: transposase-like protein/DNA-directed RNA polymerase subunit RPC12/RpoP [Parvicellaceae bacterium]|jgi:transposase-like protein/DNA-directed RNA polymerase subunit RPC12/RpoP
MKKKATIGDFIKEFGEEESCRKHLIDLKRKNGFYCKKCGHSIWIKGRTWYYRKCQKCHYHESCTSGTLFHKLKFPLESAFLMVYMLSSHRKGISTCELSRQFGVTQSTAWFFKRKVQQAMKSTEENLLSGVVEVDETVVGGKEKGKQGRSYGKKKIVQIGIETDTNSKGKSIIKRAYGKVIDGYDNRSLKIGLNAMVDKESTVLTDKWSAYPAASIEYKHETEYSNQGANFELLHWHIFNVKNWIRGTHHHISNEHAQHYINEFHFRFNRRNFSQSSAVILLNRMMKTPWLPYRKAKGK